MTLASGTLYIVATPIGNLEDVTLRALEILRGVDVIACEDTRRTRTLLTRHGIEGRLVSFHKFNEARTAGSLVAHLQAGESIALVSDGGTPAVSDPGYRLVRDALDAGLTVTPIPGPSAFVAAVSASGLPSETLTFRGFLPHRSGERRRFIEAMKGDTATQVFYESPHRIAASLADLVEILGPRQAAVARELTKRFETWYRGPLDKVAARVTEGPIKGEFCLVIEGAPAKGRRAKTSRRRDDESPWTQDRGEEVSRGPGNEGDNGHPAGDHTESRSSGSGAIPEPDAAFGPGDLQARYDAALAEGLDRREALRRAAEECGLTRKQAYTRLHGSMS